MALVLSQLALYPLPSLIYTGLASAMVMASGAVADTIHDDGTLDPQPQDSHTSSPISGQNVTHLSGHPSLHNEHSSHMLPSAEEVIQREQYRLGRPLTQDEKAEIGKTLKFLQEHQGHETQHAEMILIIIGSLILSQIGITFWKRYHMASFNITTLLGLWLVPMMMAAYAGNYRFVMIWCIFSIFNSYIVKLALESPMKSSTPKVVYKWYSWIYNLAYVTGAIGYFITILAIFHVAAILGVATLEGEASIFEMGVIVLFYGLYFGTLGRDFVDRLSDRMAVTMGYYSKTGFPRKHLRDHMCAICGDSTIKGSEPTHTLNCSHTYHEQCIRGWTIIGKKDICPYCKEKGGADTHNLWT
ncbi:hypothetical protein BASA81_010909 [Batrachochytrium salamandrivorans]|nr:hypothetical protein BASA81_010909 [Batrachochytrium salamandrivorans]